MNYEGNSEGHKSGPKWVLPDFNSSQELGELERVSRTFKPEDPQAFEKQFQEQVKNLKIVSLTEELLAQLENTDASDISEGDFERVKHYVIQGSDGNPEHVRDWEYLKGKMERGEELDMPVIIKMGDVYHKMSGNTRLMVARALGIYPKVAIVNLTE